MVFLVLFNMSKAKPYYTISACFIEWYLRMTTEKITSISKSKPLTSQGLPEAGYIRLKDLVKVIPFSQSTVWRKCREGNFPKPVKLSKNITAWKVEDIRHWMAQKSEVA